MRFQKDFIRARLETVFKRARREGDCWIWDGPVANGYGSVGIQGVRYAHRISYVWKHGKLPEGVLRNTCGNCLCIRPEHWEDVVSPRRVASGRAAARRALIEKLHAEGIGRNEIAERAGCSVVTVWRQLKGKS